MIFGHIINKSLAKIYRLVVSKPVDMEDSVIHTYLKSIKSIFNFFLAGGPEGLRGLTNPKAIVVDRWPFLAQTSIPAPLDYPIRSLNNSW